jgi:hypothetical protein
MPGTKIFYEALGLKNSGYYLIRPDMHIALRSADLDIRILESYLQKFLIVNQHL